MSISTVCPSCAYKGTVPDQFKGRKVKCPSCSTMFVVGGAGAAEPASPAASVTNPEKKQPAGKPAKAAEKAATMRAPAKTVPTPAARTDEPENPFAELENGPSTRPDASPAEKNGDPVTRKTATISHAPEAEFANLLEPSPEPATPAEESAEPAQRSGSPTAVILGLLALLLGLIGVAVPWLAVALITKVALALSAVGLLLAGAGVAIARFQRAGAALPVFGFTLCALAILVSGAVFVGVIDPGTLMGEPRQVAGDPSAPKDGSAPETTAKQGLVKSEKDGKPKDPAPRAPEIEEWIDAGQKLPAALGTMRVRVLGASIDRLKGKNLDPALEKGEYLQIRVQMEIINDDRTIEYRGWGVPPPMAGQPVPRLGDDLQPSTEYRLIHCGPAASVDGQLPRGSIRADQPLNDLLVFEPPAAKATVLQLELPAANFGASGKVRFKIPRSMIVAKATPTPTPTPTPPPLKPTPAPKATPADPKLLAELQKALKDPTPATRAEAIAKLASLGAGAASAVPDLVAALKDKDEALRAASADAIGKIAPKTPQTKAAVPGLVTAMQDPSTKVRVQAAIALGRIGPDGGAAAVGTLITAWKSDEDAEVQKAALDALMPMTAAAKDRER
jgi:HEAT repeats